MNKNRLENFSDGVFAFAATLLVLSVKLDTKTLSNYGFNRMLLGIAPHLGTFAFSFIAIGVFWVAHHRIFSFVRILNNTILWLNILYLLFIAVIPITTTIISENPFMPTAILLYSITLMAIALMHFIILEYILRNKTLKHEALTPDVYRSAQRMAVVGPACYIIAAAISFFNSYASLFFIVAPMIFYIFFSGRSRMEEKMIVIAKREIS